MYTGFDLLEASPPNTQTASFPSKGKYFPIVIKVISAVMCSACCTHSMAQHVCISVCRCPSSARRLVYPTPKRHYATPLKPGGSQVEGPGSPTGRGAVHL